MEMVVVAVGYAMLMVSSDPGRDHRIVFLQRDRVVIVILEMDLCLWVPGSGVVVLSLLHTPLSLFLAAIAIKSRLDLKHCRH